MENPTIVAITDRNDLDDHLFVTFARCHDLLRKVSVQAGDRADLRERLRAGGGGVVFTTIQKFMPAELGDRNAVLSGPAQHRRHRRLHQHLRHRSRGRRRRHGADLLSQSTTILKGAAS